MTEMYGLDSECLQTGVIFLTITAHPLDFPNHVCMRAHASLPGGRMKPGCYAGVYGSVDEARKDIPQTACCFPRDENDDPVIVESWML